MLFGEIEGTHGPSFVTLESGDWIAIAVFHSVTDVSFEQVEHFKELLSYLVCRGLFICFVELTYFLETIVCTEFDFLSVIDGFLLTHWPVKVNMLLFETAHQAGNLFHEDLGVL